MLSIQYITQYIFIAVLGVTVAAPTTLNQPKVYLSSKEAFPSIVVIELTHSELFVRLTNKEY